MHAKRWILAVSIALVAGLFVQWYPQQPVWSKSLAAHDRCELIGISEGTNEVFTKHADRLSSFEVRRWSLTNGAETGRFQVDGIENIHDYTYHRVSADGRWLVMSEGSRRDSTGRVWLVDTGTGKLQQAWVLKPLNEPCVRFSPDGKWLALPALEYSAEANEYSVRLWGIAEPHETISIPIPIPNANNGISLHQVIQLQFSASGNRLLFAVPMGPKQPLQYQLIVYDIAGRKVAGNWLLEQLEEVAFLDDDSIRLTHVDTAGQHHWSLIDLPSKAIRDDTSLHHLAFRYDVKESQYEYQGRLFHQYFLHADSITLLQIWPTPIPGPTSFWRECLLKLGIKLADNWPDEELSQVRMQTGQLSRMIRFENGTYWKLTNDGKRIVHLSSSQKLSLWEFDFQSHWPWPVGVGLAVGMMIGAASWGMSHFARQKSGPSVNQA